MYFLFLVLWHGCLVVKLTNYLKVYMQNKNINIIKKLCSKLNTDTQMGGRYYE